jgi:hypothetical protein
MISVIMDDNLPEVEPLIRLCRDMGITYLVTLCSHRRGGKPARSAPEGVSQRLPGLKKQYRHFVALRGYLERFSVATANGGVGHCSAGRNQWNLDSQGNVTFCIDQLAEPAGNLLTDDVHLIAQRMRERQRANTCQACWTSCRGSGAIIDTKQGIPALRIVHAQVVQEGEDTVHGKLGGRAWSTVLAGQMPSDLRMANAWGLQTTRFALTLWQTEISGSETVWSSKMEMLASGFTSAVPTTGRGRENHLW